MGLATAMAVLHSRIQKKSDDECWPYHRELSPTGRPIITINGQRIVAARLILGEFLGRPVRDGMEACHTCDNGMCLNPNHLWEGTHMDNMRDMLQKHRDVKKHGEDNCFHKLTEADVLEIRRRHKPGVYGSARYVLAKEFGVCPSTIRAIVERKKWKHI